MSDITLCAFHKLAHSILSTTLCKIKISLTHFTEEDMRRRLSNLLTITQFNNYRVGFEHNLASRSFDFSKFLFGP